MFHRYWLRRKARLDQESSYGIGFAHPIITRLQNHASEKRIHKSLVASLRNMRIIECRDYVVSKVSPFQASSGSYIKTQ